jgi:starvation-inducible DNA-binding protein
MTATPTTLQTILPAPDRARLASVAAIQRLVPGLVGLSLESKQAHWNVVGPSFLALHELTDELAGATRAWSDRLAERAVALGLHVDARPITVAASAGSFPIGCLRDVEAARELVATIDRVSQTAREALDRVAAVDPVSADLVVHILEGLDTFRWKLTAQTS